MVKKKARKLQRSYVKQRSTEFDWIDRYYVGASHIAEAISMKGNDAHTRATVEEAIEAATEVLENDPMRNCVIIVKIIRVVRRASRPNVIENVE